jgi:hypothetical protein
MKHSAPRLDYAKKNGLDHVTTVLAIVTHYGEASTFAKENIRVEKCVEPYWKAYKYVGARSSVCKIAQHLLLRAAV